MDKSRLKDKINSKVNELIDAAEKNGNINFIEINIKHVNGELMTELKTTYKDKIK
jgi:hypothetical protein